MIKFREKQYNATSDAISGASAGAAIGWTLSKTLGGLFKDKVKKVATETFKRDGKEITKNIYETVKTGDQYLKESLGHASSNVENFLSKFGTIGEYLKGTNKAFWDKLAKVGMWIKRNPTQASIIGALVGASLAVGYYLIKRSYNGVSNKLSNFRGKMIDLVVNDLKKLGYRRDTDFTTDPAQADYLKTKVCIVVSSTKDDLSLVINSINDPKLDSVSKSIIKTLPSSAKYNRKESDKNNELSLTLMSSNGDHAYISSITEMFIKRKYPVFLIEIN